MSNVLNGTIDQVEGLLNFVTDQSEHEIWDRSIISFCRELNMIAVEIKVEQDS